MQFAQSDAAAPPTRRGAGLLKGALRVAICTYGLAGLAFGWAHLRTAEFSETAWGETLTVWYAEALIFLAVFGGGALVSGMFTRGPAKPRPARFADPLKTSALAAVERRRGH